MLSQDLAIYVDLSGVYFRLGIAEQVPEQFRLVVTITACKAGVEEGRESARKRAEYAQQVLKDYHVSCSI